VIHETCVLFKPAQSGLLFGLAVLIFARILEGRLINALRVPSMKRRACFSGPG